MSSQRKPHIPRVALLVETSRSYGRNVIRGVGDYARVFGPWLFHLPTDAPTRQLPPKTEWDGDGIIAQPRQDEAFLKELADCKIPTVSLSGPPKSGNLPAVLANQDTVAKLALDHFRERGFVRFAYCGIPSEMVWPPTGKIFYDLVTRSGFQCDMYMQSFEQAARTLRLTHMAKWLRSLRGPVGLLVANDLRAREVLDACRLARLHVPEEIAVLGVNDDELICDLANPPLSSVIHNARRIGYEAAAMLHRLMVKKKVTEDIIVEPLGVHARHSTDLLAIEDPDVAKAVRFIRENACNGIRVDDLLDQVSLSRRTLEKRFRLAVGRPPHVEIRRVQLDRVKELLSQTDYKLEKIAEISGFSSAQYLAGLFHRVVLMTPGDYRQTSRTRATENRGPTAEQSRLSSSLTSSSVKRTAAATSLSARGQ